MKYIERVVIISFAAIGLFALHQLAGVIFRAHDWKPMSASDWAAWVQAIGSIAAIYGAFRLGERQERSARKAEHRKAKEDELHRYKVMNAIFSLCTITAEQITDDFGNTGIRAVSRENLAKLEQCQSALRSVPLFVMPDSKVVVSATSLATPISTLIQKLSVFVEMKEEGSTLAKGVLDRVFATLDTVRDLAFEAEAHCRVQIRHRLHELNPD